MSAWVELLSAREPRVRSLRRSNARQVPAFHVGDGRSRGAAGRSLSLIRVHLTIAMEDAWAAESRSATLHRAQASGGCEPQKRALAAQSAM